MTRFAEYLVNNYGTDPDATWFLDHQEVHLVLHANPDGRKHAETGQFWRKTTDTINCADPNNWGIDLNRNYPYNWGCCGGGSGQGCAETYRGPSPASEPETQAVRDYVIANLPDYGDPQQGPIPPDAAGMFLDIHSFSQLVLWPWGYTDQVPPNGIQMQTLGRKGAAGKWESHRHGTAKPYLQLRAYRWWRSLGSPTAKGLPGGLLPERRWMKRWMR